MKLGLIKERKKPGDNRVALTPVQCVALKNRYPQLEIFVEHSETRCFTDQEYEAVGIEVVQDLSVCDVLFGIKEVPKEFLLENKTYFFFSHTIKKQPYNLQMLQEIIAKKIKLIDYETLKWENGQRVLGFGRYAGIVGAYNGLLTWGNKTGTFQLQPAYQSEGYASILEQASKIIIPPIKIVLTGGGRVAKGALEFLRNLRIKEVTNNQFLNEKFNVPVFVHLNSPELYYHQEEIAWDTNYFYTHHNEYKSAFSPFAKECDLLMNGIFWTEDLPPLFTKLQTQDASFKIKVIADITCDENGSVPLTYKTASIEEPVLGWDKELQAPCAPFSENSIDVMAVGNLPNELPRDASEEFGENLLHYVLPEFLSFNSLMIENATITKNGNLNNPFLYLKDWVENKN